MTSKMSWESLFRSSVSARHPDAYRSPSVIAVSKFEAGQTVSGAAIDHWDSFEQRLSAHFALPRRRGVLAQIQLQHFDRPAVPANDDDERAGFDGCPEILSEIAEALTTEDAVCWHDGQFFVFFARSARSDRTLNRIVRTLAARPSQPLSVFRLTPATGYADFQSATTVDELWRNAQAALDCAKSSLEFEPFPYDQKGNDGPRAGLVSKILGRWARVPQSVALSVQFVLSMLVGLGAPFLVYAICDALGVDVSGPVYIGVVIVLVITATTIWIEGFLALKPTAPPTTLGSPYPPASLIIPAYLPNEAETIVETVDAFLRLDYPSPVQIIIAYNSPGPRLPVEDELQAIGSCQRKMHRRVS